MIATSPAPSATLPIVQTPHAASDSQRLKRILAIDDSMSIRTFITRTLGKNTEEFEITTAKDGGEGVKMAGDSHPDLILLDFILPDMKGDAVCQRLLENPVTSTIPVVLMSSSVADIKKTESAFGNVVKAIAKPFTPELLMATVHHVMRERQPRPAATVSMVLGSGPLRATSTAPAPLATNHSDAVFTAHTEAFPLHRAVLAIQREELTGVLRIHLGSSPILCFAHEGRMLLATSRDAETYLKHYTLDFTSRQASGLEAALRAQRETACPFFVPMAQAGLFEARCVLDLCRNAGNRLVAEAWTAGRLKYDFHSQSTLPVYVTDPDRCGPSADEWMLETLRCIGDEALHAMAWGDLSGVPIYTRDGYERIQQISVTEEEAAFLGQIGDQTLSEMSRALQISPERGQQLLYRFLCLGIFEYWPAALLRGDA